MSGNSQDRRKARRLAQTVAALIRRSTTPGLGRSNLEFALGFGLTVVAIAIPNVPLIVKCGFLVLAAGFFLDLSWRYQWIIRRPWPLKALLSLIVIGLTGLGFWYVRPVKSYIFLSPATVGSALGLFVIHRGPETKYNVSVAIDDQERLEELGRHQLVDGKDIVAAHREIAYPEVDSKNMKQVIWWPLLNPDSARLEIGITCRECDGIAEEILMHKSQDVAAYAMRIWDRSGNITLCRDEALPRVGVYGDAKKHCSIGDPPQPTLLRRALSLLGVQPAN